MVLVSTRDHEPRLGGPELRFAACFGDIDAALMHLHERLRRRLATLEPRSYAVDLEEAVIAVDAIELDHRRVFIDPALAGSPTIEHRIEALHRRYRWQDRLLHAVGLCALIVLILWGILPL